MKNRFPKEPVQYAYTMDGRVIKICEIKENGKIYKGYDIKEPWETSVELDRSDIYGVVFGIGRAV